MVVVGDVIRIVSLKDEPNSDYVGKEGKVLGFDNDCYGEERMYGTWGSLYIYPKQDRFIKISSKPVYKNAYYLVFNCPDGVFPQKGFQTFSKVEAKRKCKELNGNRDTTYGGYEVASMRVRIIK